MDRILIEALTVDTVIGVYDFPISWLRLTVRKPGAVPNAASVGLEITRGALPEVTQEPSA